MRWVILATLVLAGCDDAPPPPPIPTDAGPFDAGPGGMDATVDGSVDAGGEDLDGSTGDDATVPPDGGPIDADVAMDAGPDASPPVFDAGPLPDVALPGACSILPPGRVCTTGSCSISGEVCLSNGCEEMRCFASGSPCLADTDCAAGSTCPLGGVCVRTGGGCGDSRDCPLGFSCDSGSCIDRRIVCSPLENCPQGFYCELSLTRSAPYCFRANIPCATDTSCLLMGMCRDVTGSGSSICHIATGPDCRTNVDCTMAGEVCGSHPSFVEATCQPYGACAAAADCAAGSSCTDLWGDGVPECVPAGGSCTRQSDCAAGSVCAVPFAGGPAACLGRPI